MDIAKWQAIEDILRDVLHTYNYLEIRTPIFEDTELFARSMGQTSDVVQKQMLNLCSQRRDDDGHLKLSGQSLRPENTASVVRSYIQQNLERTEGLSKFYYMGPMFRGERPQKGRLRQFHQVGVEAIGSQAQSPYLDAEVIALAVTILESLGIKDFTVKINSLGSAEDKENFSAWLREQIKPHLSKLGAEDQNRFERNVFRVLDSKNKDTRAVVDSLEIESAALSDESQRYFQQVLAALRSLNIHFEVDPKLVRGLDYYTHTVFEITSTALGSQDALGAGGRYNNLVKQLGGPDVGAVGFALGLERIILALPEDLDVIGVTPDVYIIALDEQSFPKAWQLLGLLRNESISCDIGYKIAPMKRQMRQADKSKAEMVIILGEDELRKGVVTVKDMQEGTQEEVPVKDNDYSVLIDTIVERC